MSFFSINIWFKDQEYLTLLCACYSFCIIFGVGAVAHCP